jgi:hypothetical protein
MAAHYRPTPHEQVSQGTQTNLRDTQAYQEPKERRRLDGLVRPHGWLLHTRHTGGRPGFLYRKYTN